MDKKQWDHQLSTLATVEQYGLEVSSLELKLMRVKKERDTAIRQASAAGNSAQKTANAAHLTRDMVYKLIRPRA
jgi:hypothetical protein